MTLKNPDRDERFVNEARTYLLDKFYVENERVTTTNNRLYEEWKRSGFWRKTRPMYLAPAIYPTLDQIHTVALHLRYIADDLENAPAPRQRNKPAKPQPPAIRKT